MYKIIPLLSSSHSSKQKQDLLTLFSTFSNHSLQTKTEMSLGWLLEEETDSCAKLALLPAEAGAVFVDFISGKKNHRRQFGGGKNQPMARAVGIGKLQQPIRLLDATAGMGGDAFVFATLGCKVLMVERSPVVAALLADALQRGKKATDIEETLQQAINNLSLINQDSTDYLLTEKPYCDVIYMDPMYPEKKKSAAPKKEMKALQNLVGPDLDSSKLLAAALQAAKIRVVVKRPAKAPVIELENDLKPTSQIKSPNTRYDIYSVKALATSSKTQSHT